jgi:hypothetical protein
VAPWTVLESEGLDKDAYGAVGLWQAGQTRTLLSADILIGIELDDAVKCVFIVCGWMTAAT